MQEDKKPVGRPDNHGIGEMEINQHLSFEVDDAEKKLIWSSVEYYKRKGRKFITQTREDSGKKVLHVWRKA